jgi:hypothetical protein
LHLIVFICIFVKNSFMVNTIFIDIDTERNRPIIFSKPPDITPPTTKEEAKKMILNDVICLAQSLKTLIIMAHENQYADKKELLVACVNTINEALTENKYDNLNESKK